MKAALIILTGCTKLLGVHDFAAPDAAESLDAPPVQLDAAADALVFPDADTLGDGLLAHLTFDANPIGADASGHGHGGTCSGGTCTFTPGKLGNAVAFNGSATMTLAGDFPTAAFSIAAWISVPSTMGQTVGCAISRELGTGTGYALCFNKLQAEIIVLGPASKFTVPDTGYHHYGLTWNGTTVVTYLDGVQVASQNADLSNVNSKLFVGFEGRVNNLTGNVDDLRYYDRVLSVGELQALTGGSQ